MVRRTTSTRSEPTIAQRGLQRGAAIGKALAKQKAKPKAPAAAQKTQTVTVPGTPEERVANQSLTTGLTAEQQRGLFQAIQAAQAQLQETDFTNQEAQAAHDRSMAELNAASARQAQSVTDEMISRGMLASGTAAGALGDVEVAASNQREALNQALLSTQLRNQAIRSNILTQELPNLAATAQRQMGENIASGVVPGSFQTKAATPDTTKQVPVPTPSLAAPPKPTAPQPWKAWGHDMHPQQPTGMQRRPTARKAQKAAPGLPTPKPRY